MVYASLWSFCSLHRQVLILKMSLTRHYMHQYAAKYPEWMSGLPCQLLQLLLQSRALVASNVIYLLCHSEQDRQLSSQLTMGTSMVNQHWSQTPNWELLSGKAFMSHARMRNHQISVLIFHWRGDKLLPTDATQMELLPISCCWYSTDCRFLIRERLEKIPGLPTDCQALMTHGPSQGWWRPSYLVDPEGLWDLGHQRLGCPSLLSHPEDLGTTQTQTQSLSR